MTATSMTDNDTDGRTEQPIPKPYPLWKLLIDQARADDFVQNQHYKGKGTSDDPYIVDWVDGDAGNPRNWPKGLKWTITLASALTCFVVAFSSSAYTGTMLELRMHFKASNELITGGVSLFVLGFAVGPLIWAPLSEIYGRQIVFLISYGIFVVFSAACVADDGVATLLVLRFMAGAFGSAPMTNAGGVISDIFSANERAIAMGAFSLAPAMGPTFGPFIGGYLGKAEGWRWVMGLMGILAAATFFSALFLIPETYAPVILRRRAEALSKKTGEVYSTEADSESKLNRKQVLKSGLLRPLVLLVVEPIVLVLAIYTAVVYGTLYLLFGAYPVVFQLERGWSPGDGGLPFLGIAIGMFSAIPAVAFINTIYTRRAKAAGGPLPPENRLLGGMIGGISVPIGMFWFAWTSYKHIHWMAPVAAGVPFGFGMTLIFHSVFSYLIDAYGLYAASALAANSVLRSCFGAAFPMFTRQMYDKLGTQWASSVPAFLSVACVPVPFVLYLYGARIRKMCKYAAIAAGSK